MEYLPRRYLPPRAWRLRLQDIADAMDRIADYIQGMDEFGFKNDPKTVDAVLHNLQIAGEAARNVPEWVVGRFPELPWREMRATRNVLAHGYFQIELSIVWKTATQRVTEARPLIAKVIDASKTLPDDEA